MSTIHCKKDAQDCVLAQLFGDFSQSEILSEIKLPLVTSTLTLMSDAASNSCILRNGNVKITLELFLIYITIFLAISAIAQYVQNSFV